MLDADLYLRDGSSDVTATEDSATGVDMGVDLVPQTYALIAPTLFTGTSTTIDVKIQECDTLGGTYVDLGVFPQITLAQSPLTRYITVQSNKRYRRYHLTLGGSDTPNAKKVIVAPVPAGRDLEW